MEWENLQLAESDFSQTGCEIRQSPDLKAAKANLAAIILSNY